MPTLTDAERNALAMKHDEVAKRAAADFFRRNRESLVGSIWDFDELFQTARLVLLKALGEYEPSLGTIKNYLFTCCMRAMRRAVDTDRRGIRVSAWVPTYFRGNPRGRTNDTPAKQHVTASLERLMRARYFSLDVPSDGNEATDYPDAKANSAEDAVTLRELREMIFDLPAKEWEVIHRHFGFCGDDMTFREIGSVMGVSRQTARNLQCDAIRRLRRRYFWARLANA